MQVPTMVCLTAVAMFVVAGWAEAKNAEPGGGFIKSKPAKLGKDYYVVRKGQTDQCSIVAGTGHERPEGTVGGFPYATAKYAKAALEKFPECKGGEADEEENSKKHGKK